MVKKNKWHRLSNIDKVSMIADCSRCGKVEIEFRKDRRQYLCLNKRREDWYKKNAKRRKSPRVMELIRMQRGRCAICNILMGEKYKIDHDHKSGEFRGLLCNNCNLGIGLLGDNTSNLRSAIAYLQSYQNQ